MAPVGIDVERVSKRFTHAVNGEVYAVRDVSLAVKPGELLTLLDLSVFENVAYGLRVQNRDAAEITRAVGDVLNVVDLGRYERQQPHQLSGGEQQRVALAPGHRIRATCSAVR